MVRVFFIIYIFCNKNYRIVFVFIQTIFVIVFFLRFYFVQMNDESGEISSYCDIQIIKPVKTNVKNLVFKNMRITSFYTQERYTELSFNYFHKFIPENLFYIFATNTNLYAMQQNVLFITVVKKIKQFTGIHIIIGSLNYPRVIVALGSCLSSNFI